MHSYILPLISLLLSFMATLATVRFILTRQGAYWILPALISIILDFLNLNSLLLTGITDSEIATVTISLVLPCVLSFLWYIMIIVFHYALKLAIPENKFFNESYKNRHEARYIEKLEKRSSKKKENKSRDTTNESVKPKIPEYRGFKIDD